MHYPSVVRVFATTQEPDFESPWQARAATTSTGSGVVIGPGQIITGAHVVANATFVQVQKQTQPEKAIVRVLAVSHDCDLALLEVTSPSGFLDDVPPAKLGAMPQLRDPVSVVGFPVGGEEISITEGVVSRIEVQRYSHSQRHLLAATIDAAINAGNSGGPVFGGDDVVGIAFQKLENVDNIGEMVPPPLLKWFLDGIHRGAPFDVPGLGLATQNLENPTLREALGLLPGESGVMVMQVEHSGSAHGVVRPRDVILAIDGTPISNNGTVHYLGKHRTRFDVVISGRYVGDELPLTLRRNGRRITVKLVLKAWSPLVPRASYDRDPVYFVYGGLVLQVLSRDYLATWNDWWDKAPKEFLYNYYLGQRGPKRDELIVLTQVLADDVNLGYGHLTNESIELLDGVAPRNMTDLVERISRAKGFIELKTSTGGIIRLDVGLVAEATPRILHRYKISHDRSPNLPGRTRAAEPKTSLRKAAAKPKAAKPKLATAKTKPRPAAPKRKPNAPRATPVQASKPRRPAAR